MRAVRLSRYGGPEVLEVVEVPAPVPAPRQVLVRVVAASVNPVDWKLGSGRLRLVRPIRRPWIPGFDVAGVVEGLGADVTGFAVGQRVHARLKHQDGGASAELTVASADVVAPIPDGVDDEQAAAVPLAGQTALQGLRDRAGLPMEGATGRVLVVGASGGVGHLAVQLAREAGATVVGVCSARNAELVRSLGAHEVLDYAAPDPFRGQAPFDVVLDCVGGSPLPWTRLLRPGGRYASTMPGPAVFLREAVNAVTSRAVRPVMLRPNAADLAWLGRRMAEGRLRVVVDSRFPLVDLAQAWERSRSGRTVGKIVITVP